ncbi:hypothetical protein RHMOL_Rhmol06G0316300 [Rhododendron molle]|uniref:Uncharacterized protein n=1 Tax=Rhododendron molle TaxID=49168 RepID=A0ACC0NI87_RHOML|nr:hypothetical protein RHMOL_Rhmol06G0316300 [Rhododendron molle]
MELGIPIFRCVDDKEEKSIKHYSSNQKILLVGEGDFSFATCLATAFGSAENMVATSLDSKELLMIKHRTASANLERLEGLGCTILHEVDAKTMSRDPRLVSKLFDRIVFNFPHAGFTLREHDAYQIELHQNVVKGFLRSAHHMLEKDGEIHITHKTAYPFNKWEIEKLAEEVGLCLVDKIGFSQYHYPGYVNKRGDGRRSDDTFPVGECSTFRFAKP